MFVLFYFLFFSTRRNNSNKPDDIRSLPIMQDNQYHQQQQNNKGGHPENETMREADVKRSIIPLDERMTMFTHLLREKQVCLISNRTT